MTKKKMFGSFDPAFMGVTLFFNSEEEWRDFLKIEQIKKNSLFSEYRLLFPEAIETEISSEKLKLWGIWGKRLEVSEEKRKLILECGNELLNEFENDQLYALTAATTYQHERRHFHDWLLCPASFKEFGTRVLNCINTLTVITKLIEETPLIVPIPLSRWIKLSSEEKEQQIGIAKAFLKDKLRFPSALENPFFTSIIEMIGSQKYEFSLFTHNIYSETQPSDLNAQYEQVLRWLFEESAFCVQQQCIHDTFGPEAQKIFCLGIQENSKNKLSISKLMDRNKKGDEIIENETALKLITWCFLGSGEDHPVSRASCVADYLEKNGIPAVNSSSKEIFKALDKESKATSYKKNLRKSISDGERILKELRRIALKEYNGGSELLNELYEIYRYYFVFHKYLVNLLLKDPDVYSSPTQYNDRGVFCMVNPSMRFIFGDRFVNLNDDMVKDQHLSLFLDDEGNCTDYVQQCIFKSEKSTIFCDHNCSINWAKFSALTDLLFGISQRYKADLQIAKNDLLQLGIKTFEIL